VGGQVQAGPELTPTIGLAQPLEKPVLDDRQDVREEGRDGPVPRQPLTRRVGDQASEGFAFLCGDREIPHHHDTDALQDRTFLQQQRGERAALRVAVVREGSQKEPVLVAEGAVEAAREHPEVLGEVGHGSGVPALARQHRVIAVDLRGMGGSDKPESGYDKKTMARDVYELVRALGHERVGIAGEDIGSMVAFSFAANHPDATSKLALWEPGHPAESFRTFTMLPSPGMPHLWWFANQVDELPEKLLAGRFRLVIDHLIDLSGNPASISEHDRAVYAAAYDEPGAVRASNGW